MQTQFVLFMLKDERFFQGVVPATIAVMNGRIKVGLDNKEIELLGDPANQTKTIKTSRRDLPYVLSQVRNISSSMGTVEVTRI